MPRGNGSLTDRLDGIPLTLALSRGERGPEVARGLVPRLSNEHEATFPAIRRGRSSLVVIADSRCTHRSAPQVTNLRYRRCWRGRFSAKHDCYLGQGAAAWRLEHRQIGKRKRLPPVSGVEYLQHEVRRAARRNDEIWVEHGIVRIAKEFRARLHQIIQR